MNLIFKSFLLALASITLYNSQVFQLYHSFLQYVGVGKPSPFQLATINLTDAEFNYDKVSKELVSAFHTVGFAYLAAGKELDPDYLLYWTKWFFDLPEETKMKVAKKSFNSKSSNLYRGYFPAIPNGHSYKEAFEIGVFERNAINHEITKDSDIRNMTLTSDGRPFMRNIVEEKNVWPASGNSSADEQFRQVMLKYYKFYIKTAITIYDMLMHGLGYGEKHNSDQLLRTGTLSTFRLIHYPTRMNNPETIPSEAWDGKDAIVTGEHFDSSVLTILATFDYTGLQIKPKGYTEWLDVPADKNKLVVNIGSLLSHMSNGELIATNHRVLDTGVDRYSVPLFLEPSYDADVSKTFNGTPNQLVGNYTKYGPWMTNRTSMFAEYATTDFGVVD